MKQQLTLLLTVLCLVACGHRDESQREQAPLKVKTMVLSPSEGGMTSRYVGTRPAKAV